MNVEELYSESYLNMWNMIEDAFSTMSQLWDEIGDHDQEVRTQMKEKYIDSIREVLQTHINGVVDIVEKEKQTLSQLLYDKNGRIIQICDKLGYDYSTLWLDENNQDIRENRSLREKEIIIDNVLQKMMEKYEIQYTKANELLTQLKAGYADLGEPLEDQFMNIEDFLTDEKCNRIISRMKDVENLKQVRLDAIEAHLEDILSLYKELRIDQFNAIDPFDQLVLSHEKGKVDVLIRNDNMALLSNRKKALTDLHLERSQIIHQLMERIIIMWTILQVPEEDQEMFKTNYQQDLSNETISIHQQYLQQLQFEVQAKLEVLIPSIRNEIEILKESIQQYSTCLRDVDFSCLVSDSFSMELFEQHQKLFVNLEQMKEILEPISSKIEKREQLLRSKVELDELLKRPDRLTDKRNSGKYYKLQKALEKDVRYIPTINNELTKMICEYEAQYGEIIINGRRYIDELKEETKLQTVNALSVGITRSSIFSSK